MADQEQQAFKKGKGRNPLDEKDILDCNIQSRLTKTEFNRLNDLLETAANVKTMSELVRRVLNNRPITIYTRDKSLDETVSEITKLRKELNKIGSNFNQTVKVLNTYQGSIILPIQVEEIKKAIKEVTEVNAELLLHFEKVGKKWLQESRPA